MLALPRRTLSDLPPPSLDIFALRAPWCPITARTLTDALNVDHGLLGVWRMRGLGPRALPAEWTKGRSLTYRVDAVLTWLAARRGEAFDVQAAHRDYLASIYMPPDPIWVRRLAEREGLVQGSVRFTREGFAAYLDSLLIQ